MKLFKAMATVAGMTGLSRIAGFLRDILTAAILGAGPIADAFFVALKLPNFFRRVTAEGAFSVSFVPLYTKTLEKEGQDAAESFSGEAFSVMFTILSLFTILIIATMPFVIYGLAPGFQDDPLRYDLAVGLSRVTFPYLLLMSLTALLGGVLNAHDRFAPFAAAPIFFNLTLIAFLLMADPVFATPGHAMAWGVFAAGFVQFGLLFWSFRRAGFRLRLMRPRLTPKVRRLLALMGPGAIGAGVMHINLFADVVIASLLPSGAISHLYYADRLNQLPLGLVGVAVGTALLPMLSKTIAEDDGTAARHLFNRAQDMCLALALPAAAGLMALAYPLIFVLFTRGAFTPDDAEAAAAILMAYAVGIPAYVSVKVLSTAYWAREDTVTPVKCAIVATIFNIGLSIGIVFGTPLGAAGIALATGLAGWLQLFMLRRGLRGHDFAQTDDEAVRRRNRIWLSASLMLVAVWGGHILMIETFDPAQAFLLQLTVLLGLVLGGAVLYASLIFGTGALKIKDVKQLLGRKTR